MGARQGDAVPHGDVGEVSHALRAQLEAGCVREHLAVLHQHVGAGQGRCVHRHGVSSRVLQSRAAGQGNAKARQREGKARQGKASHRIAKARQSKAKQSKAKQSKAKQSKAKQSMLQAQVRRTQSSGGCARSVALKQMPSSQVEILTLRTVTCKQPAAQQVAILQAAQRSPSRTLLLLSTSMPSSAAESRSAAESARVICQASRRKSSALLPTSWSLTMLVPSIVTLWLWKTCSVQKMASSSVTAPIDTCSRCIK